MILDTPQTTKLIKPTISSRPAHACRRLGRHTQAWRRGQWWRRWRRPLRGRLSGRTDDGLAHGSALHQERLRAGSAGERVLSENVRAFAPRTVPIVPEEQVTRVLETRHQRAEGRRQLLLPLERGRSNDLIVVTRFEAQSKQVSDRLVERVPGQIAGTVNEWNGPVLAVNKISLGDVVLDGGRLALSGVPSDVWMAAFHEKLEDKHAQSEPVMVLVCGPQRRSCAPEAPAACIRVFPTGLLWTVPSLRSITWNESVSIRVTSPLSLTIKLDSLMSPIT